MSRAQFTISCCASCCAVVACGDGGEIWDHPTVYAIWEHAWDYTRAIWPQRRELVGEHIDEYPDDDCFGLGGVTLDQVIDAAEAFGGRRLALMEDCRAARLAATVRSVMELDEALGRQLFDQLGQAFALENLDDWEVFHRKPAAWGSVLEWQELYPKDRGDLPF